MVVLCFWFDLVGYGMLVAVALFAWVVDCLLFIVWFVWISVAWLLGLPVCLVVWFGLAMLGLSCGLVWIWWAVWGGLVGG